MDNDFEAQKQHRKSSAQLRTEANQRAMQWQDLIGTNGINTRADLARYLGVSRVKVTQVLKRLISK